MNKSVLIICWDFPPNNAIGGRRWAKIAKSLVHMDFRVSVLCKYTNSSGAPWVPAKILSRLKTYFIKPHFLSVWLTDYKHRFSAIRVRIAEQLLRMRFGGTVYDRATGIESVVLHRISEIVEKEKCGWIFVTGAPFNLLYYTALYRAKHPHIKIVCDYRDPWLHAVNYGMKDLSASRKREEQRKQDFVFEHADFISAPNEFLLKEISDSYSGNASSTARFITLPHAYDPDDVVRDAAPQRDPQRIRIVYAGSVYMHFEEYISLLDRAISFARKAHPGLTFSIELFTPDHAYRKHIAANADVVSFLDPIGEKVFSEIAAADFVLIFLSEHNRNYLTSKFFEFLPYGKPYLYVGPAGHVSEKIRHEKLGFVIEKEEDLISAIMASRDPSHRSTDTERYAFDNVTRNFLLEIGAL